MLSLNLNKIESRVVDNYDLSSLIISNYKNAVLDKARIGIVPHGMRIHFSNIYLGSIYPVMTLLRKQIFWIMLILMRDNIRVFAIQDLYTEKRIDLNRSNRPKQKDQDKFLEKDIQKNFGIALARIHLEHFIGRVRNLEILSSVWLMNIIDLPGSTWQMLCHVWQMPPIGP